MEGYGREILRRSARRRARVEMVDELAPPRSHLEDSRLVSAEQEALDRDRYIRWRLLECEPRPRQAGRRSSMDQ